MQDISLKTTFLACLSLLPALTDAFWRLPCRGRNAIGRLDPIIDPGQISSHVHTVHGGGSFSIDATPESLAASSCTSCGVLQDKSAYWTPALYFMHTNGSAELVDEVGGMLAYYLLYGENVTAFPNGFRMVAGDPFQRNFTWPIPDPPKSSWTGAQISQAALRQKAVGFNCLNYAAPPEGSLQRHFLPNKAYLDEHCTDGIRMELMFPSCWNGKDVDSEDHKSHVAYPDLVMTGTCPEGYETQLVSLFYETIWDTYAFKDADGYFALSNGDPTGFGYHGDFMFGWEDGILQQAVDTCTSPTGIVNDCEIFNVQSEWDQNQCFSELPAQIRHENVEMHPDGLPGGMPISWGPAYAKGAHGGGSSPPAASLSLVPSLSIPSISIPGITLPTLSMGLGIDMGDIGATGNAKAAFANPDKTETTLATMTSTSTSTSSLNPTPATTTRVEVDPITEDLVIWEADVVVSVDADGVPFATTTGAARIISTSTMEATETTTVVSTIEQEPSAPEKRDDFAGHMRRHIHHHGRLHKRGVY
ncbi:hypothetical protein N7468_007933 [Penicillium chermesinum]|uniref:DUF1996 domain-containing protein n=1 Tax=Penicillium chermesinum TaxID=63820 RepID=A0A9W9NP38_9EURO|nr:uncharacterized protein N7468_007933 [Penicillium chermesinum]KAJ5223391.1 hypothetical protein N7468_007933 [Penicillium chermesinum]KAJ6155771.1 hypothetical protein N7470_006337 [Penicillium chermesinum]